MVVVFETQVFGGQPVTARASLLAPEPEVGIFDSGVEDLQLFFKNGREFTPKLYQRAEPELSRLQQEVRERAADDPREWEREP